LQQFNPNELQTFQSQCNGMFVTNVKQKIEMNIKVCKMCKHENSSKS